ncbi:NosD domain-containing protein [Methanoculleus sp.]|uniref:NosD domain-containing protein n=1 Tax=Methanoculleus sp. TaxID=90427 RepID=UPI00262A9307|nr:NosD domain-containing protein [Methanoculleus sp.]MDD4313952.1 NosD domain-containing protein [Methanoculleus sp.]
MKKSIGIFCLILLALLVAPTAAATLYVDDDGGDGVYTTISEALGAVTEGDTIFVRAGTYPAFYSITVPNLTIKGEGAACVTVDSTGNSLNIGEQGAGTTFEGLRILKAGQVATYGSDCIIRDCVFDGLTGSATILIRAPNCTFANNSVQNLLSPTTNTGVNVYSASARIVNNTFVNIPVTTSALYIRKESTNATIEDNLFENCTGSRPLTLREVTGCTVANNTFKNTHNEAIRLWKTTATDNVITGNSFGGTAICFYDTGDGNRFYLNNNISGAVLYTGTAAPTTTYWNATTPVTYTYKGTEYTGYPGNFWSNYTGDDTDGDGIIDTSYVLPDGLGTDHAPLAGAWKDGSIAAPVQEPTTWYVDDDGGADFTTISDAVSASTVGDTIVVKDGAYTENVLVDKLLVIRTENGSDAVTVTAAAPDKPVFDVDADGATVEGFAVRGPTNEHIAGIEIVGFNNCVVTGNDCAGCYNGIHLGGTAANNTVEKNSCHENTRRGISLRDTAHDNLIYNNTCENNADDEICAKDQAADNIIWANTFDGTVELATANTYHSPAEVAYTYRGTAYTGYVGNHYSLYTGADTNGDGIGDTPMSFGTYADDYPMMGSWQDGIITYTTPSIARIALSPDSAALVLGETQQFDATAYDVADAPVVETVFVWASSNTSVGTVNATGFFETLAVGTTDVTATAGGITGAATVTVAAATAAIEWAPYVTGTTTTTATIHWRTDLPSNGSVEYADETYYAANGGYEHTIDDPSVTDLHHVDLAGLAPGTRYHYHVVAEGTATGDRTFSTFPESGEFTFIVYGDTQESQSFTQLERHSLVAERIAAEEPLFVLHLGDTVNMVDDAAEWERFFEAGDPVFANTSFFPALGNHEENSSAYYDAFGMPEWYSFDCAGAHVAVLDSNTWIGDRMDDETAWLEADLAGEDGWKFVAFHHPPYTSEGRNPGGNIYLREEWGPVIANESVSAVFSGHVHAYERYLVDGVNYVVTGTGGGPLYPLSTERPDGYQNSLEHTLGYTKVIVHENGSATMEFVEVALVSDDNNEVLEIYPDGMSFDAFTLTVPEALPDLAVTSLEVPASASTGTTYTVTATVENTGDAAAPGTAVALAVDGTEVGRKEISALGPGGSATVAFAWTPSASGTMEVAVQVDPDCTVTDANRANNLRSGSVAVEGGSIGPSINDTIVLSRGWNFVSTPRRLSAGNDTAEIFLSVDMAGRPLYAYDAATETWLQMNPSSQVRPLQGYWVYADQDASVPLSFNEDPLQAPPETTLSRGWNAIGFSDTIPAPARDTLSSVGDAWTTLIGYDAGAGVYETSMINGATGLHSDMGEMKPMQGYWLYMTGSGTLCAISA